MGRMREHFGHQVNVVGTETAVSVGASRHERANIGG
jgi:hypothetical protein